MGDLARARQLIEQASRVLFITGAGLSADSGLPTYRGLGGLYNGLTEEGMPIEGALSATTLRERPEVCWKYLAQLGRASRVAQPNTGHVALADFLRRQPDAWLLTQNIDGLHRQADTPPERLIAIHGELDPVWCHACGQEEGDAAAVLEGPLPPLCKRCGGVIRPAVVLFEEALPLDELTTLRRICARGFEVVVIIGTSAAFPYILEPALRTLETGGAVIEINPEETVLSGSATVRLAKRAVDVLSHLLSHKGH